VPDWGFYAARLITELAGRGLKVDRHSVWDFVRAEGLRLKTYGPHRLQDEFEDGREGLRKRIRPHEHCSQPRWRSARPGPHKSLGIKAPFFEPG